MQTKVNLEMKKQQAKQVIENFVRREVRKSLKENQAKKYGTFNIGDNSDFQVTIYDDYCDLITPEGTYGISAESARDLCKLLMKYYK